MKPNNSMIEQTLKNRKSGAQPQEGMGAAPTPPGHPPMSVGNMEPEDANLQNADFDALVEELTALISNGEMPEGFDLNAACADPAFIALISQFPAEAAVRIYVAEKRADEAEQNAMQRVNTQMRARGGLPKSQRGGVMSAPQPDYRNMESDAFKDLLFNVKKTARNGGRTRL